MEVYEAELVSEEPKKTDEIDKEEKEESLSKNSGNL